MNLRVTAESLKAILEEIPSQEGYWVACSGGLDSTVLLHLLSHHRDLFPLPLRAIHVDHHAQPAAPQFRDFVSRWATRWEVPLVLEEIRVPERTPEGWEAAARRLRYEAMARHLSPGEILLTAHHADDQLETILLNLLRGSGHRGLRGMSHRIQPLGAGSLFRPLLDFSRKELRTYAEQAGIRWLEDPTNRDPVSSRNYLRSQVIPALLQRWPEASRKSALSARLLETEQEILSGFLEKTLDSVSDPSWGGLSIQELRKHGEKRLPILLRAWIGKLQAPPPSQKCLEVLARNLLSEERNRAEVRWKGYLLVTHDGCLFLVPPLPDPPRSPLSDFDSGKGRWILWPGWGYLELTPGMRERISGVIGHPTEWRVFVRAGGERLHWHHSGHHVVLKEMLREMRMPPWLRQRTPVLAWKDSIFSIGNWFWDGTRWDEGSGKGTGPVTWVPEHPGLRFESSRYSSFLEARNP